MRESPGRTNFVWSRVAGPHASRACSTLRLNLRLTYQLIDDMVMNIYAAACIIIRSYMDGGVYPWYIYELSCSRLGGVAIKSEGIVYRI